VYPDPAQPRKEPDAELLESIRANGILQPITVRPHPDRLEGWMIIDGERRWRGADGILTEIPVIIREDLDDRAQRLQTQLVSNVGKPLTPVEEARAFAELMPVHGTIAGLARALGRPERSVGERLQLLELGPWLELIEDGRVPLSLAVKHLLPLRGCPDEVHAHALELALKSYHYEKESAEAGHAAFSSGDFARVVREAYRGSMYPLTKTKSTYDKQPAFDTKNHDAECDCGRISFELSAAKRSCCGNPAWWRSRDRAAKKSQKPKAGSRSGAKGRAQLYLPEGTPTVKLQGYAYEAPKGMALLTRIDHQHGARPKWASDNFDPSSLKLDPAQLVLIETVSGQRVATKQVALVAEAQKAWQSKWEDRRKGLVEALRRATKEKGAAYRVSGPGVTELLSEARVESGVLADLADANGIDCPASFRTGGWPGGGVVAKWLGGLDEKQAASIATSLAYLIGTRTKSPHEKVEVEARAAKEAIERKPVPWTKAPKGSPVAKTKSGKKKGKDKPPPDESIEEDLDDEELGDE
jgi:ParB/RepB/Spo0J family partition protein